jgi:carbon storage regulator
MLVLSRKKDEQIVIDGGIVLTVVDVRGGKVRIGIDAPRDLKVHRKEIAERIAAEALAGAAAPAA